MVKPKGSGESPPTGGNPPTTGTTAPPPKQSDVLARTKAHEQEVAQKKAAEERQQQLAGSGGSTVRNVNGSSGPTTTAGGLNLTLPKLPWAGTNLGLLGGAAFYLRATVIKRLDGAYVSPYAVNGISGVPIHVEQGGVPYIGGFTLYVLGPASYSSGPTVLLNHYALTTDANGNVTWSDPGWVGDLRIEYVLYAAPPNSLYVGYNPVPLPGGGTGTTPAPADDVGIIANAPQDVPQLIAQNPWGLVATGAQLQEGVDLSFDAPNTLVPESTPVPVSG
jgi:hypothetical protein